MLNSISDAISNLPNKSFEVYYQDYIKQVQDNIISKNLNQASANFKDIEDVPVAINGLNKLVDSLNTKSIR